MDDFEKLLKTAFLDEVTQSMADAEQCFLSLEGDPHNKDNLDKIFRLAHNLKGSAKASGFEELSAFTHELESFLLKLKKGEIPIQSSTVTLLLKCNDHILKMHAALKNDFNAKTDCTVILGEIQHQSSGQALAEHAHGEAQVNEPEPTPQLPSAEASPVYTTPASTHAQTQATPQAKAHEGDAPTGDRFLSFCLGSEEYAIPLLSVREVIAVPEVTPVPFTASYYIGIMNLRGQVITIVDLRKKLGIKDHSSSETAVIICDLSPVCLGVVVDSISSVIAPNASEVSERPIIQSSQPTDYITHIYKKQDKLVMFLDIRKTLNVAPASPKGRTAA